MANVCVFGLTVNGDKAILDELRTFLAPALEPSPGGYYGDFVLNLNGLWSDLDSEGDHIFVGLECSEEGQPIIGPTLEDGQYTLYFGGASKWCPPLGLMDRLSVRFPGLDFHLGATTEHELVEEWHAKNGELTAIEIYSLWIREGVQIVYIHEGKELDPPQFDGDAPDDGEAPLLLTPEELVANCVSIYQFFFPGRECPGLQNGKLLAKAREFVRR